MDSSITFILSSLNGGGIQIAAIRLIKALLRRGKSVTLIAINGDGPVKDQIPEGCTFIDIKAARTRFAALRMYRYLRSTKPSLMISAQTHLNTLMILLRLLTGYPKHLIVQEHNTFLAEDLNFGNLKEYARIWMIRFLYPLATKIVSVSGQVADSIYTYAKIKKEILIIENGIDLEDIQNQSHIPPSQTWFSEIGDKKIIVGVGRLSAQKNYSSLLAAFSHIQNEHLQLLLLGEGEERPKLISLAKELGIQDRVLMPGFVNNPYAILSRAHVFVSSSRREGYANVIIEALACGLPIVTTDHPGASTHILEDQPFTRIVPGNDPTAMAKAIEDMLALNDSKQEIMEYSRQFDIAGIADRYIELIEGLQAGRP